ncbi:GNAT family N-acetyltransferase [Caldithrix abyssi]|nr:GNAT family N-acetyltransferase [Caldithrix abyssi]
MIEVVKYHQGLKIDWDNFISDSKNGTFLFYRDYMEYHADRFDDYSLLFYENEQLIAVMPANIQATTLFSSGGLTFGGIIAGRKMKTSTMLEIFSLLKDYCNVNRITALEYKSVPHIYHSLPAEEDLYALFLQDAHLLRRDVSATIFMQDRVAFSKGRKWCIGKSKKNGLEVRRSYDFESFMNIEEEHLLKKHGLKPVHSAQEMELLSGRFPDNIKLFAAYRNDAMYGGVVVYDSKHVAHTQYISSSGEGNEIGAVDSILEFLITKYYAEKTYFDFGISNERNGDLNLGLNAFKESFGARTVVYDRYSLSI